ncbi:uncharacterized protein B0H18DRAFT_951835 [Fomitopsis serialis]|uniref:uncharacterized protein n=1 Tax=Fomitopsis serialis TaxID=139415 RepID=UPI0020073A80|nr:uncharacterized protein B0H18DRAFT_951835 [Neoantrodia serialis]KAH9933881.1 hypothetical protein B0H18DRAFT_951835 [Neoantrodia serialis]
MSPETLSYIGEIQEEIEREKIRRLLERQHEEEMYGPLQTIFTFLTNFEGASADAPREFQLAAHTSFPWPSARAAEACTPGIAKSRPAFDLVDKTKGRSFWDGCVGFAEIKIDADGNKPPLDGIPSVKTAILQCAHYARYHMSFRPFWLFSVTLLLTGTVFRVMIADRAGIILSPLHSIVDDTPASVRDSHHRRDAKTFVRVVRALTRRLTNTQLGQDPSVTPIPRDELRSYMRTSSVPSAVQDKVHIDGTEYHRSYRIDRFGNDSRVWCSSYFESKHGLAFEGDIHILKSSWRNPLKVSETDVYLLIGQLKAEDETAEAKEAEEKGEYPRSRGVADLLYGGDVCYHEGPQAWSTITVAHIRGQAEDPMNPSKVLHRIIVPRVAHQYLCDRGILHCDISPGNTLLWLNEPALPAIWNAKPSRGFLTDFDMATVDDSRLEHLRTIDPHGKPVIADSSVRSKIDCTSSRSCETPVAGTLQFMAFKLHGLDAGMGHTPAHDLESAAYVLGYSVLRRLVNTPGCPNSLEQVFEKCFGGTTLQGIISQRATVLPLNWHYEFGSEIDQERTSFIREHLSLPLAKVLFELDVTLQTG